MDVRSASRTRRTGVYDELRPLLFSIAYRMVGSVGEAEDIVQEAFLRFHRESSEGTVIESPKAWLSTVTTRLAIGHERSARVQRERYVGTWLPEPILTDPEADVAQQVETADSVSLAFLVLLESLTPVERAVFLLREVFDYGYDEIAEIVGKSEDNCRQIAVRARKQVERSGRGSRRHARGGTSCPDGSSRPSGRATRRVSSSCSPRTSSCTPTAAARDPRSPAPFMGEIGRLGS